jgi:hypothetical protein
MKKLSLTPVIMIAGLLAAAPAFAQTTPKKQATQDGNSPTTVGPGSKAYKQSTDGDSPTIVGPGSKAYKQNTQSLSHAAPPSSQAKTN